MSKRAGFTLIELVVVVAIVGIAMAVAVPNLTRERDRGGVEAAVKALRARVERARALAAEVGPHIGLANPTASCGGTPCFTYTAACNAAIPEVGTSPGYLWARINADGSYAIPVDATVDAATGAVRVACETGSLATLAGNSSATVTSPTVGVSFSFASTGRVIYSPPGAAAYDLFVQARSGSSSRRAGFRVLPSGITCAASSPGNAAQCDLD